VYLEQDHVDQIHQPPQFPGLQEMETSHQKCLLVQDCLEVEKLQEQVLLKFPHSFHQELIKINQISQSDKEQNHTKYQLYKINTFHCEQGFGIHL
jgi:hypothetical protein